MIRWSVPSPRITSLPQYGHIFFSSSAARTALCIAFRIACRPASCTRCSISLMSALAGISTIRDTVICMRGSSCDSLICLFTVTTSLPFFNPRFVVEPSEGGSRVTLDRDGPLFHVLYNERTGCERVNARAKELGIERPRVRNGRSVANLNTLMYVIVNVRVLAKAKSINQRLLQIH